MKSLRTSFIVVCCLLAAPALVWATSFVMPSDAELVDAADAIVIATAASSQAQPNPLIGIVTVTDFALERVLKGTEMGSSIRLTELGGQIENRFVMVHASPRFSEAERVLLFLERTPRGEWRVLNMILGKFNFARDREGRGLLVRSLEDAPVWTKSGESHQERARSEDGFLKFISARVRGETPADDYFVDSSALFAASESRDIAPMTHRTPFLLSIPGVGAFRWQNPTATFVRCDAAACALPSGLDGVGAITNGMGLWNGVGAGISYSLGGTTTSTAPTSTGSGSSDNVNNIVYNDPHSLVNGTFTGSGTLGIGIVYGDFTYSLSGDSEVFINIPEGDVVMNDGISSGTLSQTVLNVAMAHELGHTLGFQHSNDAPAPHTTTQAVMNSFVNTGCGGLCTYDLNAATTVYGSGGPPPCTAPSISTQPQSQTITSGNSANLSVGAAGTTPLTFQWFRGNSGDTSQPISGATGSSFNTGALTVTTSFWVRVTGQCIPVADSNTATITVTPATCTPPSITQQPQSTTITSGSSANLSVGASGSTPFTFQWFRGAFPDTSQAVGTNSSSFNTGALTATTQFWVRVQNSCGTTDSSTAVVNVEAACTPPSIFSQPQNQTIQSGGSAILSVGASGTGLTFQWFRGNSPDTSNPVSGATFATVSIGPITQNTNFWVRVTGLCGTPVNSATVTVTVTATCTAISITSQPANTQISAGSSTTLTVGVTGSSPAFQWFQGTPPGGTPVGANSPSLTVAPGVTTSYWVRVSNSCSSVDSAAATVTVCPAGTLCLTNGRFRVTMLARNPDNNATDTGLAVPENQTFGFFALTGLTGDPNNLEVFVKIVGPLPDGTFIVFFGGLTGFEYSITVRDTITGLTDTYTKPANQARNGFAIFRGARSADENCPIAFSGTPQLSQGGTCIPGDLCLLNSRFRIRLNARNHRNNQTAAGVAFPKTGQFGYFALPGLTGDLTNPEVFVKVLGPVPTPGFPDRFWVFFAGLTDFEYTLTVTDQTNGQTKTFFKPAERLCGGADTAAFPF